MFRETIESWKERLPNWPENIPRIIHGTWMKRAFLCALPERGFAQKSKSCKGERNLSRAVALFVSASGHKEEPIFI